MERNYGQRSTGRLEIQIGGPTVGTQYDQLIVTGSATLDGGLNVARLGNYLPELGDEFTILQGIERVGQFSSMSGLAWGSGIKLFPIYGETDFRLRAGVDAGPRIVGATPRGIIDTSLRSFQVTFDEPIDAASFTAADLVLTGPQGAVGVNNPTLVSGNTYQFTVDTQVAPGEYTLTIGPNVTDAAGNPMDQSGDAINGQRDDVFTHRVTVSDVQQAVLFVNVTGSYNADAGNFYQNLLAAGARAKRVNLAAEGVVAAALAADDYDQVWVFDLSTGADSYAADWQAIADWSGDDPSVAIISDARIIASLWNGRWQDEGLRLTENYYQNLRTAGGGLLLGTDDSNFQAGINTLNGLLGLDGFAGLFQTSYIPVDQAHPLMTTPNDLGSQLQSDSSPGRAPYGVQPNGRILYPVAWHQGDFNRPGITATIPGTLGFQVVIASPSDGATFPDTQVTTFLATQDGGVPDLVFTWSSDRDGALGTGQTLDVSLLSPGYHTITLLGRDALDNEATDSIVVHVALLPAAVQLDLQAASDSGYSNADNLTKVTEPALDVIVSRAGRIDVDFDGDAQTDQTQTVEAEGRYSFNSPPLTDGTWPMRAWFYPLRGAPVSQVLPVTIDTRGPRLLPHAATEQAPLESRQLVFNERTDYQASINGGLVITLTAPDGTEISVTSISGSGANLTLAFPPVTAPGMYTLRGNTSIFDLAGNPNDQNGDGNNGVQGEDEPVETFTLLPDVTPPAVESFTPVERTSPEAPVLTVRFNEPMDAGSVTPQAFEVTGPAGMVDSGLFTVVALDLREFAVQIPAQSVEGDYQVRLTSGIAGQWLKDLSGNPLAADFQAGFALDKTPPAVTRVALSTTGGVVVNHVDITFSEPISVGSFIAAQVMLVGPQGPVTVGAPSRVSGNTFRLPLAGQRTDGVHTLTIEPDIRDAAGNPMAAAYTVHVVIALPNVFVTPLPSGALAAGSLSNGWDAEGQWGSDVKAPAWEMPGYVLDELQGDWEELLDGLALDVSLSVED